MNSKTIARCSIQFSILTVAALTFFALPAKAWNNVGHRAIAELTWRQLDTNERRAVSDLLKQHPHYKELLIADVPKGVDTNEWAFLMAAIWPDWIRPAKHGRPEKPESITKYDIYPHAIGYPFLGYGETNRALLKDFYIAKPDSEMWLSNSILAVKNQSLSAKDRAISLSVMLHLMGDLHQPLHAANMVTSKKPRGEGLGGDYIALEPNGTSFKRIDFHSFWDQLAGVEPTYKNIAAVADKISADPELKPAKMREYRDDKTVHSWVQESFRIAVSFAYSPNHVRYVHEEDLKSKKIPESAIPVLTADYISRAKKTALRRLALASQRLTDELKQVW